MAAFWDSMWTCGANFDSHNPDTWSFNIFEQELEQKLGMFKWAFCKPAPMYETLPDKVNKDRFREKPVVMYHGWCFIATSLGPMAFQIGQDRQKSAYEKLCKL